MIRWIGVVAAAVALAGCCTEAGCSGTLVVKLTGLPTSGTVELEVRIGLNTTTCSVDVDAATGGCNDGSEVVVTGDEARFDVWTGTEAGDEEQIHLAAWVDGLQVVDDDVDPGWGEPYYPNGKRCGGACVSGSVSADLGG